MADQHRLIYTPDSHKAIIKTAGNCIFSGKQKKDSTLPKPVALMVPDVCTVTLLALLK
jgi:hypothetical protein